MSVGAPRSWDDGLDGAARRIVELDYSPLRVLAGPGTGKTTCMMYRVARLLKSDANPQRILVTTFTRTSASDLKRSLSLLNASGGDKVKVGNLHSFCFGLLRRQEILQIVQRVPRPLLDFEVRFLLEDLKRQDVAGLREGKKRLKAFAAAWASLQSEEPGWPLNPADRAFHTALLDWLRFHRAMLIGELVTETLRYLQQNPESPALREFDHVIIDEYQDLNRAEQRLLELLSTNSTVTVIGDEDQSIYSFKHAHPEGIAEFPSRNPNTRDEILTLCRRCPKRVVGMANSLIEMNSVRTAKKLNPDLTKGDGEVHIVQWPNLRAEAEGAAEFISRRVESGSVSPGQILVLSPRRPSARLVVDELSKRGILARSFFQENALDGNPLELDESAAQQAFTILNLLVDSNDIVALRCWLGFGHPTLRSRSWMRIREYCDRTGDTPSQALRRLAERQLSLPQSDELVARYRELQERLRRLQGCVGDELLDALFPTDASWAEPLRTLAAGLEEPDCSPEALLDYLRTSLTQPELPIEVEYVRVMSPYKAKGLTADLVVVVGCVEGLLPAKSDDDLTPLEEMRHLEEQRRLFYVAMTRARHCLILSSATTIPRVQAYQMRTRPRGRNPSSSDVIASRFLAELGPRSPQPITGAALLRQGVERPNSRADEAQFRPIALFAPRPLGASAVCARSGRT